MGASPHGPTLADEPDRPTPMSIRSAFLINLCADESATTGTKDPFCAANGPVCRTLFPGTVVLGFQCAAPMATWAADRSSRAAAAAAFNTSGAADRHRTDRWQCDRTGAM